MKNCSNCSNVLPEDAKFCGKCGVAVMKENSNENSISESQTVSKKSPSAWEMIKRISKIILVVFFVAMTSQISSAQSKAGDGWIGDIYNILLIVSVITFFALLSAWWKNRKTNKKWFTWRWITLLIVLSLLGFSVQVFSQALIVAREKAMQNPDNRAEYINSVVDAAKAKMSFPKQVDDSTVMTDITAEGNAIRYHYLLSGIDTSNLSNESLKNSLSSGICQSESTKEFFAKGIDLEFSYAVKDSTQNYLVQFTKLDCQS